MEEKLQFDVESWNSLFQMMTSKDEKSRNLAFGMLENIDYTNENQMEIFEEKMQSAMTTLIPTEAKGKLVHHYFSALSKQNVNQY